jgi:cytochrome c
MMRLGVILACVLAASAVQAQLRGHGGPVRALAVSADGKSAVSGSFDTSAIRWSLAREAAEQVLRFHDGPVNAVAMLKDGRVVTSGEDTKIAIWTPGEPAPATVLEGHTAPVVALAASPDGTTLASASWDNTVRLWPISCIGAYPDRKTGDHFSGICAGGGTPRLLEGHSQNVNGVAFTPDGRAVVSAGYDLTVRIWPIDNGAPVITTLPSPLNSVAVAPDGEIVAGAADGKVYFLSSRGELRGEIQAAETPVIAVAVSADGALVAAAGIRGSVAVIERTSRNLARTLVGPGLPVWSVAFMPDNHTLLTGGTDRVVRRWNAATGDHLGPVAMGTAEDPLAQYAGERGAEVYRACVACHTLTPDEGNRAGPTLAGIFGRRIATLPGYRFSDALKKLDIVWTPETVAKLFEIGPAAMTPGTKMPEQTIGSAEDRDALVKFLARVTTK